VILTVMGPLAPKPAVAFDLRDRSEWVGTEQLGCERPSGLRDVEPRWKRRLYIARKSRLSENLTHPLRQSYRLSLKALLLTIWLVPCTRRAKTSDLPVEKRRVGRNAGFSPNGTSAPRDHRVVGACWATLITATLAIYSALWLPDLSTP
jgi:hypothetical protein